MEVHHHSSPATGGTHPEGSGHRKKWIHYLWEFLMLFLAVFCGFLAENLREHTLEKKREKQYIASLVQDVELDISSLNKGMYFIKVNIKGQTKLFKVEKF